MSVIPDLVEDVADFIKREKKIIIKMCTFYIHSVPIHILYIAYIKSQKLFSFKLQLITQNNKVQPSC